MFGKRIRLSIFPFCEIGILIFRELAGSSKLKQKLTSLQRRAKSKLKLLKKMMIWTNTTPPASKSSENYKVSISNPQI
jgi:hypothetical protein